MARERRVMHGMRGRIDDMMARIDGMRGRIDRMARAQTLAARGTTGVQCKANKCGLL